jgi:hypothetical protein
VGIDRTFLVFAFIVGVALAGAIILVPQFRTIGLPPYIWILIAFALFEGANYARGGGARGSVISMQTRIIGFAIALALMFFIPMAAGIEVKSL